MGFSWRKHWYKATMIGVSIVLLGALAYVYLGGGKEPNFPVQGQAAPFVMDDIQGKPVSMEETVGQVKLLYFYFANCPDVCPITTHMLSGVQERLQEKGVFGTKSTILQVTFDPERDTVESLQKYAANFNADLDAWRFLRGTEQGAKEIGEAYGIYSQKDEETGLFLHSNTVILIDGQNQIRKRYNGNDLNDELIAKDVMSLVNSL